MTRRMFILMTVILILNSCKENRPQANRIYLIPEGVINVRSGPALNNAVSFQVRAGAEVKMIHKQTKLVQVGKWMGYWMKIKYQNRSGWILSSFAMPKSYEALRNRLHDTCKGAKYCGLSKMEFLSQKHYPFLYVNTNAPFPLHFEINFATDEFWFGAGPGTERGVLVSIEQSSPDEYKMMYHRATHSYLNGIWYHEILNRKEPTVVFYIGFRKGKLFVGPNKKKSQLFLPRR